MLWIEDFFSRLGIERDGLMKIYWQKGNDLIDGLQCIDNDRDIVDMIETTRLAKTLYLLVDHNNFLPNFRPEIIEKKAIADAGTSKEIVARAEASSSVPCGSSVARAEASSSVVGEEEQFAEGSSDSGSSFDDSDYDVEDGDDDLFCDNVDSDVRDNNEPIIDISLEDDVALEDTSLVLRQEDEEQLQRNSSVFNPLVDMPRSCEVKQGLVFSSVQELRLALNAYSVRNRVMVNKTRNDTRRLEACCKPKCPCFLKATKDSVTGGFVVRKCWEGKHTCQANWELKYLTAP
jgi:hypothetical protein